MHKINTNPHFATHDTRFVPCILARVTKSSRRQLCIISTSIQLRHSTCRSQLSYLHENWNSLATSKKFSTNKLHVKLFSSYRYADMHTKRWAEKQTQWM